jgi:hypothetical protein
MNIPVSKTGWMTIVLAGALAAASTRAAEVSDVQSPSKRQETLDRGKKLLAPRENQPAAADPFHSEAFDELLASLGRAPGASAAVSENLGTHQAGAAGPRSPHDLLQAIAAGLKPSGFYVLGGQPTLVFGQKRVKAGGILTITFEGTEYTLEIISIDRPNFTLRLNREEFTRPIK